MSLNIHRRRKRFSVENALRGVPQSATQSKEANKMRGTAFVLAAIGGTLLVVGAAGCKSSGARDAAAQAPAPSPQAAVYAPSAPSNGAASSSVRYPGAATAAYGASPAAVPGEGEGPVSGPNRARSRKTATSGCASCATGNCTM